MTLVAFDELMADAERGGYAVGYFESWNLESLLAVADAAVDATPRDPGRQRNLPRRAPIGWCRIRSVYTRPWDSSYVARFPFQPASSLTSLLACRPSWTQSGWVSRW